MHQRDASSHLKFVLVGTPIP